MDRREAIDFLLRDPAATGLFCDFDGTLSDIVDEPSQAAAVEGAVPALAALARRFALVAVISGRSLPDLRTRLSAPGVVLLGAYGRERSDRPRPAGGAPAAGWEPVSAAAAARMRDLDGVVLEHKGAGLAIHYRRAPGRAADVARAADELAAAFGLEVRAGRLVAELVEPGPGKGDAVEELIGERALRAVLYAGDDAADLEAFERVRSLEARSVLVAVQSEEAPDELNRAADLVVESPREIVAFLAELVGPPRLSS